MSNETVNQAGSIAELISEFGLPIIVCAIVIIIACTMFIKFLHRWDANMQLKAENEREKNKSELDILIKQRNSEIEQSSKLFDFVTDIQTKQIVELQSLTEAIALIKDELRNNQTAICENSSSMCRIESSMKSLANQNNEIIKVLTTLLENSKQDEEHNREIIQHINKILFYMEQQEIKDEINIIESK